MSRYRRILVPIDFSPASLLAARYGCAFARRDKCQLDLLHIVQDLAPISVGGAGITASSAARYIDELQDSAEQALSQTPPASWTNGLTIQRTTQIGTPADCILEHARAHQADLICLGTHGRGGFKRLMLGSVAERVVQHAACQVFVVRSTERDFVGAGHEEPALRRILVPIDFSSSSDVALAEAADLASRTGAVLHLLHVVEDNSASVSEIALAYPVFQGYIRELVQKSVQQLDAIAVPGQLPDKQIERRAVVGAPIQKINDYAALHEIDLIVMGTHGRSGASHWFLGSVAERIVRSASCPVLVVPSRKPQAANSTPAEASAAAMT